jgi:FAD/FMN-containing dehydrogenase
MAHSLTGSRMKKGRLFTMTHRENTNRGNPFAGRVARLAGRVQGQVIQPGDPGYEAGRRVWNALIDRRPALILRCRHRDDVVAGIQFARDNQLSLAVRGGGHNVAGSATIDGGIVLDLSGMNAVQVDRAACLARVQAGAVLAEVDRETQRYGLATPTGNVSKTGIAGLTLSGGLGWLRRKHGMGIDNLVAVEMVTAGGRRLRASEDENPDLFWAVRGGGGNFGVVTRFEFRLHPVGPEVAFLAAIYPATEAPAILTAWRDWTLSAPEEASTDCLFWTIPAADPFPEALHNRPVVILGGLYAGPVVEGLHHFQSLRRLAEPLADMSGLMPYVAAQQLFDAFFPEGMYHYWKSLYLENLNDAAVETILEQGSQRPSPQTLIPIRHLGGAISRVADSATAVANRSAPYLISVDASWTEAADSERNVAWARRSWADMHRHTRGGVYLNFGGLGEEGPQLLQAAYGSNYERLLQIKKQYDPDNLFHTHHNIKEI